MTAHDQRQRRLIAMEAARLIAEHGMSDYYAAKRKAAQHLGLQHPLPRNEEVEQALGDYQRLFQADTQPRHLKKLREAALQAMRLLERFEPRLTGSVLSGAAHRHSDVNLHLFAATPEEVGWLLDSRDIPFQLVQRHFSFTSATPAKIFPVYRFVAGEVTLDLAVFPLLGVRQAPLNPVNGRPMERISCAALDKMLK
ncbi:MAG: hypothetical protein C4528_07860 [Gammaproteobacteria bacterium]|nr:MAG: hypothetical protein C4528_07860 [Gammaproteobacteria bacterium]